MDIETIRSEYLQKFDMTYPTDCQLQFGSISHEKKIRTMAITQDNKFLITGSQDQSMILWNLESRTSIMRIEHLQAENLDEDGEESSDEEEKDKDEDKKKENLNKSHNSVIITNRSKDSEPDDEEVNDKPKKGINCVAVSPYGKYLISVNGKHNMIIWNLRTREVKLKFDRQDSLNVRKVAISMDSKYFVTGGSDGNLKLWNIEKKGYLTKFSGKHRGGVTSLEIALNGKFLVSGSRDKSIIVWDYKFRTIIRQIENAHNYPIWGLAISPDSKFFATGSTDNNVKIWNLDKKDPLFTLESALCSSLIITNEKIGGGEEEEVEEEGRKYLISCSYSENSVKVWSLTEKGQPDKINPTPYHTFEKIFEDGLNAVASTNDNKHFLAGSISGKLKMFSIPNKKLLEKFEAAHEDHIVAVAVSSEGRFIVSGSKDKSVKVWDMEKKQLVHSIKDADESEIYSVAFSKNSSQFATGSKAGNIKVWDFISAKIIIEFQKAHSDLIMALEYSPDNKYLISGSYDKSIKCWLLDGKKCDIHFKDAHLAKITALQFTQDENHYLISASEDKSMKIWDLHKKTETYHFKDAHTNHIYAVASNSQYLVSGSSDNSIKLWDLETKEMYHHFKEAHKDAIWWLSISTDGKYLVSASVDKTMKLWNLETGHVLNHFTNAHDAEICVAAISSDKSAIISGSYDRTIKIWKLEMKSLIHSFKQAHERAILGMSLASDENTLASFDGSNEINLWTIIQKSKTTVKEPDEEEKICSVAISSNGQYVVYGCQSGKVGIWDESKKTITQTTDKHKGNVRAIQVASNDNFFITGSADKTLIMWNLKTGSIEQRFKDKQKVEVIAMEISSNDEFLVTSSADKSIYLWNLVTFEKKYIIESAHNGSILSVAISNDLKYIASASEDHMIKTWDFDSGALKDQYKNAHNEIITSVEIHANSKYLISTSADRSIKLWNIENKTLLHHYEEVHEDSITSLAIGSRGNFFISGSKDRSIKIWNIPSIIFHSKRFSIYLGAYPHFTDDVELLILPYNFNHMHDFYLRVLNVNDMSKFELIDRYKAFSNIISKKTTFEDIKNQDFFKNLEKMDIFGNIPFDYVLGHEHMKNSLRINFLKFERKTNMMNFMRMMFEFKNKFLNLLKSETKSNSKIVINFLNLCIDEFDENDNKIGRLSENYIRPDYGLATDKLIKTKSPQLNQTLQNFLMKEPSDQTQSQKLKFYRTTWPLDFQLDSEETYAFLKFLGNQTKRFYFENKFILLVLDYFWKKAKLYQQIFFYFHSGFMILYTVDCVYSEEPLKNVQIALLIYASILYFNELAQLWIQGFKSFWDFWNFQDFICYSVIIIVMSFSLEEIDPSGVLPYLKTIGLFSGYFRWIGYLRVFDGMRSLIRTIIEILYDMRSLLVILIFTISAYSAILESFNYGGSSNYFNNIYNAYLFLYDSSLNEDPGVGLKAISMIFPFVINVIFLNMLISIMGDTFDKLQEKSLFADNQERLKLIIEIADYARYVRTFRRGSSEKEVDVEEVRDQEVNLKNFGNLFLRGERQESQVIIERKDENNYIPMTKKETDRMKLFNKKNKDSATKKSKNYKSSVSLGKANAESQDKTFKIDNYIKPKQAPSYYLMICENDHDDVESEWEGKMNFLSKQIDQTKTYIGDAIKSFDQTRKELKGEMSIIRETTLLQISLMQSNINFIAKYVGKATDCTIDTTRMTPKLQDCYFCIECNMEVCSECTQECHQAHALRRENKKEFVCLCSLLFFDCKKRVKCTYKYTGKKYTKQIGWYCHRCCTNETQIICNYCKDACHNDHDLEQKEILGGFYCCCPEVCAVTCKYSKEYVKQKADEQKEEQLKTETKSKDKTEVKPEINNTENSDEEDEDEKPSPAPVNMKFSVNMKNSVYMRGSGMPNRSPIPKKEKIIETEIRKETIIQQEPEAILLISKGTPRAPKESNLKRLGLDKKESFVKGCSFEANGSEEFLQECFYCKKCEINFCKPCSQTCHKDHDFTPVESKKFICECYLRNSDCAKRNNCTLKITPKEISQSVFICNTCNLANDVSLCLYCIKNCHQNHDVKQIMTSDKKVCACSVKCENICKYAKYLEDDKKRGINSKKLAPIEQNP